MSNNLLVELTLPALDFFFQITKNYGLAIILLTLAVKAAFWSMTAKQYESMAAMRKIQPKMKVLQEKHKKDPQKLQQEMLVLYKEHGVNPFSGCLPMLIQLPIMIALYTTLCSKEFLLKTAGKTFLWIKDISFAENLNFSVITSKHFQFDAVQSLGLTGFNSHLVYGAVALPLLAVLVAYTTYLTQKTMDMDPEQRAMMMFMPIIMLFICYNLNAGVLLYWVVSNAVTVIQQLYIKSHSLVKEEIGVVEVKKIK